jgi:hypothetical protein
MASSPCMMMMMMILWKGYAINGMNLATSRRKSTKATWKRSASNHQQEEKRENPE